MTRYRWAIPVGLAFVCFFLAIASMAFSKKGDVGRIERLLQVGDTVTAKNLKLEKGKLYELYLVPTNVGLNNNYEISAALAKGDNVVFEVADSYWHERGVWREGGESGTWEEKNVHTNFQFRVPETDTYDLEISLEWTNGAGALPVRAAVLWHEPWFLTMWPLLFGGLFLLGLGGWTAVRAGKAHARMLMEVGRGSKVDVNGNRFEVVERMEHWELGERVGVELRLRDETTGADRYLSVTGWWEEYTMGEEDYERTLQQIYIGVPLTPEEEAHLATVEPGQASIWFRSESFRYDSDNSGMGSMATERDGEVYRSDYYNYAYRATHRIPRRPGGMWLECTEWKDLERTREWWLSEMLDWKSIEVAEFIDARMIYANELQKKPSDPFGLRTAGANDPFGLGGEAAAQRPFSAPGSSSTDAPASRDAFQPPSAAQPKQGEEQEKTSNAQAWQTNDPNDPKDWN